MKNLIRLSQIHAICWYGYQDSIPVDGNLLLAGVTGSGKSILMDLVQLVLVGDQRLVRFNQSATGDRSDRTLKGYCLGDTKQEDDQGRTQYMRQSAVSYVALEFTWPNDKKVETWGLRVEFGSAAEANTKPTPFMAPKSLRKSDFLDAEKRCLGYAHFKEMITAAGGRIYSEGIEPYLRDMAQPTHLNFDRAVLRSLLPTAMSFTFLKSFNEFARNFILPGDKLDISDVTASYRTFLAYERDLKELNDQYAKLKQINATFDRLMELRRDRAVTRYLEAELRHQHASEDLEENESRLTKLKGECAAEETRLAKLEEEIPTRRQQLESLRASINETPEGRLYNELKSRNERLARDIGKLSDIGGTVDQALKARVRNARAWLNEVGAVPAEVDASMLQAVERAVESLERGGAERASENLRLLASAAKKAADEAARAAQPKLRRLSEVRQELGKLRGQLAALNIGKLPFSTRLLDALNSSLLPTGRELPARHLRALCEVNDERWRPAIEVAFGRKFAIVVSAENFEQAEKIYHDLKLTDLGGEGGRESLVNPHKAIKLRKTPRANSLAHKLTASDPIAESVISNLFGDLVCCESLAELRALPAEANGILPDGFMARGAFVERARFYDGIPFIGEKGLEQQRAWLQKQSTELSTEERRIAPLETAVRQVAERCGELFEIPHSLTEDLIRSRELPKLQEEQKEIIERLANIDRAKFDALAKEENELARAVEKLEKEKELILSSEKRIEHRNLARAVENARDAVKRLEEKFRAVRNEQDISRWLKRLEELRTSMLREFPNKEVAANRLNDAFHEHQKEEAATWERLKAERRELAQAHGKFADLPVESDSNDAHQKQFLRLHESDIPDYTAKAERERKNWEQLFRTQVLEKLHQALGEVVDLVTLLNTSLKKRPIGTNTYELRYRRNPDYQLYHELLEANAVAREEDLFFTSCEPRFRDAIAHFLKTLTEAPDSAEATRLLDYRHYYEYDMEVVEADGRKTSVDRHSGKFSGGENQSPYFIAILASYLRAYRRYNTGRRSEPSIGLVPIDEAFSKLSGERIKDCITALKTFDLQGVFSMSTGNIPYAFEHCDWLVVVSREERRQNGRLQIRNIPVSLARDSAEAREVLNA